MNELKALSNQELVSKTKLIAAEERRLSLEVLKYLREIEFRRLYAEKYSSLFEFVVHELHYSDGAAYRRIQAMRLLKEVPQAAEPLKTGEVSLSTVSALQSFFQAEKKLSHEYTPGQKADLLEKIKGKSSRETERLFAEISPRAVQMEKERMINAEQVQITVVISKELHEKLETLKGLLAHQIPDPSYAGLLEKIADMALKKLDPLKKRVITPTLTPTITPASTSKRLEAASALVSSNNPSFKPAAIKRHVWHKAQGQCEHRNLNDGRRCSSRFALQIDHILPIGKGGKSTLDNLQLLCRTHNQYKNLSDYGFLWERVDKGGAA